MQAERTATVTREVRIAATPETIFAFFTDPVKLMRWKGVAASLDATPGGEFRVDVTPRDVVVGEYVEVDPPKRIVFTWGWEGSAEVPPGTSTVEITLTPDGDETVVTLVHSGIPEPAAPVHAQGWDHFLPRLAIAAAGGDPGPDPYVDHPEGGM